MHLRVHAGEREHDTVARRNPCRIDAEEDIARGHCFLVTDEAGPLAVFSFTPGPDDTYAKIVGAWHSADDYHVIHRVAAARGHGVARAIFKFAAERADYLRCDTHEDNAPMRHTLESFGFHECGTITVANGTQRIAYDWIKDTRPARQPTSSTSTLILPYQTISHAIPFQTQIDGTPKPHDFNVLISNSEILSGELHATFPVPHAFGNIAPARSACNAP